VFGDWSVATEDQATTLDAMFRASQATGIGIDQLGSSVVQFGAPLRQVGFSFEQSIGLLGKFEKEGVNSELVMGSLRIALGKMAKESATVNEQQGKVTEAQKAYNQAVKKYGEDSTQAKDANVALEAAQAKLESAISSANVPAKLQEQIAAIKAAGTAGEANALALELFGARAGPDMAAAIREGRFDLGELFSTIESGSETIDKAVADTDDAGDLLGRAINGLKVQFGDFFTATAGVGEALGPLLYALPALTSGLGALGGKALGAAASLGSSLIPAITGSLLPALAGIIPAIGGGLTAMFTGAVAILGAAIPIIMAALPFIIIGAIVAAIAVLILNPEIRDQVFGFVGGILDWIGQALGGLLQVIGDAFGAAVQVIGDVLGAIGDVIGKAIQLWIDYVLLFPVRVAEAFLALLGIVANFVSQAIPKIAEFIGKAVSFFLSIPGKVAGLIGQIVGVFTRLGAQVLNGIVGLVGKIVSTILGIPGKIGSLVGDFANVAKRAVQAFMGFILDLPGKVAGILGDIGKGIGDVIGGLIPHFATGAETVPYTGLAVVHEGEMIVPARAADQVRSGQAMIDYAPQGRGSGSSVQVTVNNPVPERASTSVQREMRKLAYMGIVS
jgi:phage-related minor tail protein